MSTASPLPLQPLPPPLVSQAEARALKQQVASRLQQHRQRRPRVSDQYPVLPLEGTPAARSSRVAESVAARFAGSMSYRDFLQAEAQRATQQAEAAAEVARRNAAAIATVQAELLSEIEQWHGYEGTAEQKLIDELPLATPQGLEAAQEVQAGEPSALLSLHASASPARSGARQEDSAQGTAVEDRPEGTPLTAASSLQAAIAASPNFHDGFFTDDLPQQPVEPAVPLPANLIEFPRQLVAARRARPRLAEGPLREDADAAPERAQLRIFEVEASAVSTEPATTSALPEWHTIRLDAQDSPRAAELPDAQMSLALPIFTAPLPLRIMAVTVDGCCITAAFLLAVAVASYASPVLPGGLLAVAASAGTLFAFGLLYYMLFFSLNDATPGMRYARIGLCTFSDDNPTRASMRRRVFAVLLAGLPLGLGWVWACMDEDGLGWHDRISRMYPREY